MKHIILTTQTLLLLLLVNACKKDPAPENTTSTHTQPVLSDTAWLKLSTQTPAAWAGLFQEGIQDIDVNSEDQSLIVLTNENLITLDKQYKVGKTTALLNPLYFLQIRLLDQHIVHYSFPIYDGSREGIIHYKAGFCIQDLTQTHIQTQTAYTRDPTPDLSFTLVSTDDRFRIYRVTNTTDNTSFVRVQLVNNGKFLSSTDIVHSTGALKDPISVFMIHNNIGVIIGDQFYEINSNGQVSDKITFDYPAESIIPYKDGILVADGNNHTNYYFHAPASEYPYAGDLITDIRTSVDETYTLLRRSKVSSGESFISGEFVFINNETGKENLIRNSSIRIEDIKAFWLTNTTVYIMSTDGLYARLLK